MSTVAVLNTDAGLTGKTIDLLESAQTITGLKTFDLDPAAPFAVTSGSAKVTNLDADKLDGIEGSAFLQKDISAITDGQILIGKTSDHSLNIAAITAGTGITVTNGAGTVTIAASTPTFTLLKAGSGTSTAAGATDVDTIAITGLTAKDTIKVEVFLQSVTQNTAQCSLRNTTDGVNFCFCSPSPLATTVPAVLGESIIRQQVSGTTAFTACFQGMSDTSTRFDNFSNGTITAGWTSSWTLGLRHGGVTAGGTLSWSWAVYKLAGQ